MLEGHEHGLRGAHGASAGLRKGCNQTRLPSGLPHHLSALLPALLSVGFYNESLFSAP